MYTHWRRRMANAREFPRNSQLEATLLLVVGVVVTAAAVVVVVVGGGDSVEVFVDFSLTKYATN